MTIATRKQRDREEMRKLILDAARRIFLEKGYEQASIRNIAEAIEYSPGTIYLYFKEKDEIFHALHELGFQMLLQKMRPLEKVEDPFERLKEMGRIYMDFALNNKDLYDLMFIMEAPINVCDDQTKWKMGSNTLNYLKEVLRQCMESGRFAGKDVEYLSFLIWSSLHGMCALYCRNRCGAFENMEPLDLMKHGYRYFVDMIENC